ncbi:MAG: ATP-binding protein [Candidatus Eremiobacteraeota bacterium]|nr:ATP-binding protein [Candidatus Eremiobacteraeota bacterium]
MTKSIGIHEGLNKHILSEYPTPIIRLARKIFDKKTDNLCQDILNCYNYIWAFIGHLVLADYFRLDAPSNKHNLLLISTIRSMNTEKWIQTVRGLLNVIREKTSIPELISLYSSNISADEDLQIRLEKLAKRAQINYFPLDKREAAGYKANLLSLLENISFLAEYPIIFRREDGLFLLKGEDGPVKLEKESDLNVGDVILYNRNGEKILALSPFIVPSTEPGGIRFFDLKKDQESYRKFVRTPGIAGVVKEYQNILAGNPDFSKIEETFPPDPPFPEISEKLEKLLAEPTCRRILVEGHPGAGKTMLISRLEKFVDPDQFHIIKYYLKDYSILNSTTIFTRFLYTHLNNILDNPLKPDFSGAGWHQFRKKVLSAFVKSQKKAILAIDSVDVARKPAPGERVSIDEYLQMDFPRNLYIIFTARTGDYPLRFDSRINIPCIKLKSEETLSGESEIDYEQIQKQVRYYGGNAGYIFRAINETEKAEGDLPESIRRCFNDLLFRYNFFHPVREQVYRYLAAAEKPSTLQAMASDLEIYAPVILRHLKEMYPVIKTEPEKNIIKYGLFIPAFAQYIKSL